MSYFADYAEHAGADAGRFFKATLFRSGRLLLGLNCLEPGQAQAVHDHADQDKFYLVLEGEGAFTVGAEAATFRAAAGPFAEARARGREAMAFEYVGLFARRERFRAAYRAFFREWDVLLTPLALTEAPPHSTVPMPERVIDVDGAPVMQWLMNVYPGLAVLSGQPATSFPVGLTAEGLPIGLQAIGPYLEDRTPIRFADLVAREFGGFRAPPGFA